ncbi:HAD family hydrolase [uncultured Celeribacter sp.]|uniref:HAD family hydrolase n=1 Tax=uncultured Celeribacter sp. TaxID=1303376 RepID=UPI002AA60971|nr:HAD family hydrolase [uncultured Celeribacter sp.]
MARHIEAILFDKDGTLMDFQRSWGPWGAAMIARCCGPDRQKQRALAEALGIDLVAQRFLPQSAVIAGTPDDVLALLLPFFPNNSAEEIAGWLEPDAESFAPVPVPGVQECCAAFRQQGLGMAVVTNDFEAAAQDHLAQMELAPFFDVVIGYDSGYGGKPAPGPCLGAAERLGVAPEACVMVGDSLHDLEAGWRAGMLPVAVLTGVAQASELADHAAVVLNSVAELPAWLSDGNIGG